jgi:hypothetical protein
MPTTTTVNALESVDVVQNWRQNWSDRDVEPDYHINHEESGANSTFGVCCECDVGLYDKSEFVCRGYTNTCNACHNYHINLHIGGEHGGCN